jgi:hypothetical protein
MREINELETKTLGLYYDKIAGGSNIGNSNNYTARHQVLCIGLWQLI